MLLPSYSCNSVALVTHEEESFTQHHSPSPRLPHPTRPTRIPSPVVTRPHRCRDCVRRVVMETEHLASAPRREDALHSCLSVGFSDQQGDGRHYRNPFVTQKETRLSIKLAAKQEGRDRESTGWKLNNQKKKMSKSERITVKGAYNYIRQGTQSTKSRLD